MMASCHEEVKRSAMLVAHHVGTSECTTVDMVGDVNAVEPQSTTELISEEVYKDMSLRFKWNDMSASFLDLWLEYWGRKLMVDPDANKGLEEAVMKFVTSLLDHKHDQEPSPEMTFDVNVLGIGSYYSHAKKRPADEFDFLCESQMRTDQLRFVHQPLPSTETTSFSRPDFFRIYDEQGQELKAEDCKNAFQERLKNALKRRYTDCAIECNGPALSVIIKSIGSFKILKSPVKVDMTFGIPLDAQAPDHIWPLQSSRVEFGTNRGTKEMITPLPNLGRIAQCHFVPFGDLWRVSFARYEGERIRNLSKEKRGFLVALKVTLIKGTPRIDIKR